MSVEGSKIRPKIWLPIVGATLLGVGLLFRMQLAPATSNPMPSELVEVAEADIQRPDAESRITVHAASRTARGNWVVELDLSLDQTGSEPIEFSMRAGPNNIIDGLAYPDPDGKWVRFEIPGDAASGQYLLSVRIKQESWNPNRRFIIHISD